MREVDLGCLFGLAWGVVAILALAYMLSGCASAPVYEGVWAADHTSASVKRKQENREIKCADPEFDTLICMKPETAFAIKNSCKQGI